MRKLAFFLFVVSLALFAGQANAQRCLPKMRGIRLTTGMVDGFYSASSKNETGYSFGTSLAICTLSNKSAQLYLQLSLGF